MEKFIAIALAIVVTVMIGATFFMGDSNSVKSSVEDVMTKTTNKIGTLID